MAKLLGFLHAIIVRDSREVAHYILDGELHVLCSANDENREILGFVFESESDVWNSRFDVSEGKAVSGVSATRMA